MKPRERVLHAFHRNPGPPDRPPLQFDLCRSLTDAFGKKLGIEPVYSLSYYEDLTYRISANAVRTAWGATASSWAAPSGPASSPPPCAEP